MRILIDTNVIIYRENSHVVSDELQELMRLCQSPKIEVLVHPLSLKDLERDQNKNRRKITLSKLGTYQSLENPPRSEIDNNFTDVVGVPVNPNEKVDNDLLYALYRNAVFYLITEDNEIHNKAEKLGIENRVLKIKDAIKILKDKFEKKAVKKPIALKKDKVHNLDKDDPFFDSLKEEYPHFEEWFRKISREGRDCFVHRTKENRIGALLIYKEENESIGDEPTLPPKERLKLCTFKVTYQGRKLGELFIKLSTKYAIENDLTELYLTHFTKNDEYLVELISEYGFDKVSIKNHEDGRKEDIFVKKLFPQKSNLRDQPPLSVSSKYWPMFKDGSEIKKFIVPIQPKYHHRLFTNLEERQTRLTEHLGDFLVEGNAIKKAYLSHSNIKKIDPGDLVLFYHSRYNQMVTSLGVVEDIYPNLRDPNEIIEIVGKRSVYRESEIKKMAQEPTLVLLFKWQIHLPKFLSSGELRSAEILKHPPQSIREIAHKKYQMIKEMGKINERFTVA